ncbi:LPXTG cell wall anchor domain-containing protein [Streptococcus ovuberis]|uniref:LPXTG cell wall anchor domain-containing protein n=1 Tax=Streptococcus ovuberis TaxID=1936207 RepID=A0A7X6N0R6_9STRE|nr:Ig-like domain-containing protein [Streptococcus ovuberis]NKZ20936.1 LPXTG cell wall anchor domain-containing protein [Streptococcus ovuberis]
MTTSNRIRLLTVAALATVTLVGADTEPRVFAHTHTAVTAEQGNFSFTAIVLGENGKTLANKTVSLTPTTGNGQSLSAQTDDKGMAVFSSLPLNTNYSVSVNGVEKGYTIRSGVAGEAMVARFTLPEDGIDTPNYSTQKIMIKVVDEEAEGLAGQTVELKDPTGQVVGHAVTQANGQVAFADSLIDGTFYDIFVNGKAKTKLRPGQDGVAFLESSEIVKPTTVAPTPVDELEAKRAYVAKGAGVDLDKVTVLDTPKGKALMYPHDNHHHVILVADIDVTKPFNDGHDHHEHEHDASPVSGQFTFVATVVDQLGNALPNRVVKLIDITTGEGNEVATAKTDENGRAVLTGLPLLRSLSVLVDGKSQGHTVRTGQDGDERFGAFIVDGVGTSKPVDSKQVLTVQVRDEEAVGLADQTVTLKDKNGRLVAETRTDKEGRATFNSGLIDGLFYDVFVNGKALANAFPGQEISVALSGDQIVKPSVKKQESKPTPKKPDTLKKAPVKEKEKISHPNPSNLSPKNKEVMHSAQSDRAKKPVANQNTTPKATQSVAKTESKKTLPHTGDNRGIAVLITGLLSFLALIGLAVRKSLR